MTPRIEIQIKRTNYVENSIVQRNLVTINSNNLIRNKRFDSFHHAANNHIQTNKPNNILQIIIRKYYS